MTKSLEEYQITVGDKSYPFYDVPMTLTLTGKWALSYGTIRGMMLEVSSKILASNNPLTFDELDFLLKTKDTTIKQVFDMLQESKTKDWKELVWEG